ncbi:MAG: hypothetical protein KGK33_09590, partial [Hyphomicrobiales bacterium]|nr:hypothetical protein [Hyphomicrobiales bacterium]
NLNPPNRLRDSTMLSVHSKPNDPNQIADSHNRYQSERCDQNTAYEKSLADFGEVRRVKLEFSQRGGLTHHGLASYYRWLQVQSNEGGMFLRYGDLVWETMHEDLLFIYPHKKRAGLQLADAVASAFFKAHDCFDTGGCDPQFAKLLGPRMGRYPDCPAGQIAGYGVKLMPYLKKADLLPEQAAIFKHYGYPKQWRAPALISAGL